jgi:uncharacterized membrane protein YhaH (DUF805 family)
MQTRTVRDGEDPMSDQYPQDQQQPNPYGQQPGQYDGQQQYGGGQYAGGQVPTGPDGEPPLWAPWYGISLPKAFARFWKKYVRFDGRASRSEFWWYALCNAIIGIVIGVLYGIGIATSPTSVVQTEAGPVSTMSSPSALFVIAAILFAVWGLAQLIPGIALYWRRLHDANLAGPFWFLGFIPGVGGIILLVLSLMPSKPEGARFDRPDLG